MKFYCPCCGEEFEHEHEEIVCYEPEEYEPCMCECLICGEIVHVGKTLDELLEEVSLEEIERIIKRRKEGK